MKTAVVIANRDEPDLGNTVANIREVAPDAEVVVIDDPGGRGPQQCRHEGIVCSDADVIIVTDGHVRFAPDTIAEMSRYVQRHPKAVACAKCYHNPTISFEGEPYMGARIAWKTQEPGNQFFTLSGKWRKERTTGKIGCVMGACYGFSREWYVDGLRAPWRWGTGWGCDEEVLSITNWLCGGENVLLDLGIAHLARTEKNRHFGYSSVQLAGVWANRYRMLAMLPMSDRERKELAGWLDKNGHGRRDYQLIGQAINKYADAGNCDNYAAFLSGQKRSFADWMLTWCDRETERKLKVTDLRKELAGAGVKGTAHMDRNTLTRVKIDLDKYGSKPATKAKPPTTTRSRSNWGAKEKPRHCVNQQCKSTNSRIRSKSHYPNPDRCIRSRECLDCRQRYTTREVL